MAEGGGIIKKVAEAIFKLIDKDGTRAAARKAAKEAEEKAAKDAAKKAETDALRASLKNAKNPLDLVPPGAEARTLHPVPGGSQYGTEYKWVTKEGQTVRLRAHGPDPSAPPGSNAANGDIYRVQVGGKYMDKDGNLYPRNMHNPNSPHYNPGAANDTHIPWPGDIPFPGGGTT